MSAEKVGDFVKGWRSSGNWPTSHATTCLPRPAISWTFFHPSRFKNDRAQLSACQADGVEAQIETRHYRRGVGNLFLTTEPNGKVKKLQPMPARPAFLDFFNLR